MAESAGRPRWRAAFRPLDALVSVLIVVADQITKAVIQKAVPLYSSVTVVPGFIDLTHVQNTGTAFGMLNATHFPYKEGVLALVAASALVAVWLYAASLADDQFVARLGLALILGGAAGNLIDRIASGAVVDFVDVYWRAWHFWAFNVADAAITVGVAAVILDMLVVDTHVSKTA
jgi:signal peptidase II